MKRYKKEDVLGSLLKKYKYTFLIGFVLLFVMLSAILGLSTYLAISRNYLSGAKMTVRSYIDNLIKPQMHEPGGQSVSAWPSDPRMVVQYFYVDSNTKELKSILVGIDEKTQESAKEAYTYAYSTRDFNEDCEEFKLVDINGYKTLSYTKKVDQTQNVRISVGNISEKVSYIKVYMNVEGEESTRTQFVRIYYVCVLIMLIFAFVAGMIMAREGIRPLKVFVQKQVDFVNDASHELRTPLAVVQSKIENILANPNQSVYEASEDLAISLNEINRLTKLTSELLTLARNDKDNIKLDMQIVNVSEELKKIVEPFVEIATIQERHLVYTGTDDIYGYLDVDKFKQIIIVNIDNALKYTEAGDEIDITLSATNSEITIEIKDTGIGINDYTKQHIFERFYREDKARSRETGGNGLGLAIAYTLTNLQKGKISVDHNSPKGTKFVINFPRVKKLKEENKQDAI